MDTNDVIHAEESYLVPHLQRMLTSELEHHAQTILENFGCNDYKRIMRELIKTIPSASIPQAEKFNRVQQIIAEHLPSYKADDDLLQRLAVIMTLAVLRKHEEIVASL